MKRIKKLTILFMLLILTLASSPLIAKTAAGSEDELGSIIKVMVAITAFLIAIIMWLILVYSEKGESKEKSAFAKFMQLITQRTPIEKEQDILLDHDFDGIRELNNKIPPWFMAIFYGSIIWAAIYMTDFHLIGSGDVQEQEYLEEVKLASLEKEILNKSGALIDEETVTILTDITALSNGKEIFVKNCAACHGMNGEGLVGPNLTDDYWIHGNKINDLFRTVKYGVPAKGMISWQAQLDPTQMQEVSSYVLSLRGTNPPNQKAAEGQLFEY